MSTLAFEGPANKNQLHKRTKIKSFATVFEDVMELLQLRLIRVVQTKPRRTRYGTNTEVYALTGKGLTAFLTKVPNWRKLELIRDKNAAFYDMNRVGGAFTVSEFETLQMLGGALILAGIFKDVLDRMYLRIWHDLSQIPKWPAPTLRPPVIENYESLIAPSFHMIEAFTDAASTIINTGRTIDPQRTFDPGPVDWEKLRPFYAVLDALRDDKKFAFSVAGALWIMKAKKEFEVDVISLMLSRLPKFESVV